LSTRASGSRPKRHPALLEEFPSAFAQQFSRTYFEDWLRWTGITNITPVRFHPTLNGTADEERRRAHAEAREQARTF
jgi:FMN-dependent NADH-azoreductase